MRNEVLSKSPVLVVNEMYGIEEVPAVNTDKRMLHEENGSISIISSNNLNSNNNNNNNNIGGANSVSNRIYYSDSFRLQRAKV